MPLQFTHPLARHAKIWSTTASKGKGSQVLVVVTTLALDPESKKHKADKVKRLSDDAARWISENPKVATHYMLVSRPKEWDEDRETSKRYPTLEKSDGATKHPS